MAAPAPVIGRVVRSRAEPMADVSTWTLAPLGDERVRESALHNRLIVVVGPEREAVAATLASQRQPATVIRSGLFAGGVVALLGNYALGLRDGVGHGSGVASLASPQVFLAEVRVLCDDLLGSAAAGETVIECDRADAAWLDAIALVYPDAELVVGYGPPLAAARALRRLRLVTAMRTLVDWYRDVRPIVEATVPVRVVAAAGVTNHLARALSRAVIGRVHE